jgi:hypothetical protein
MTAAAIVLPHVPTAAFSILQTSSRPQACPAFLLGYLYNKPGMQVGALRRSRCRLLHRYGNDFSLLGFFVGLRIIGVPPVASAISRERDRNMSGTSTRTALTDHWISACPLAEPRHLLRRPSACSDTTGLEASSTSTCRSHQQQRSNLGGGYYECATCRCDGLSPLCPGVERAEPPSTASARPRGSPPRRRSGPNLSALREGARSFHNPHRLLDPIGLML